MKNDPREYGKRLVFSDNPSAALKGRAMALGAGGFFDKARDIGLLVSHIQQMLH